MEKWIFHLSRLVGKYFKQAGHGEYMARSTLLNSVTRV